MSATRHISSNDEGLQALHDPELVRVIWQGDMGQAGQQSEEPGRQSFTVGAGSRGTAFVHGMWLFMDAFRRARWQHDMGHIGDIGEVDCLADGGIADQRLCEAPALHVGVATGTGDDSRGREV